MARSGFLLDANVFIEASRRYYAFDILPSFWDELLSAAKGGHVFTIDRVGDEITLSNDPLADWMVDKFDNWVVGTKDSAVLSAYREVMKWAYSSNHVFDEHARSDFAEGADGWLIAFALANNCCLITQEVYKPGIKRRIPLPNVCNSFSVQYMDTFALMRTLKVAI